MTLFHFNLYLSQFSLVKLDSNKNQCDRFWEFMQITCVLGSCNPNNAIKDITIIVIRFLIE